jgi:hypothetical protein
VRFPRTIVIRDGPEEPLDAFRVARQGSGVSLGNLLAVFRQNASVDEIFPGLDGVAGKREPEVVPESASRQKKSAASE